MRIRYLVLVVLCISGSFARTSYGQGRGAQSTKDTAFLKGYRINLDTSMTMRTKTLRRLNNPHGQLPGPMLLGSVGSVVVEKELLRFTLAPVAIRMGSPPGARSGHYVWRMDFTEGQAMSFVLAADTVMKSTSTWDIVNGSSLRRCSNPKSISSLNCKIPIQGNAKVRGDIVIIEVLDAAIVAAMRKLRPEKASILIFEPQGRFRTESMQVSYWDKLVKR